MAADKAVNVRTRAHSLPALPLFKITNKSEETGLSASSSRSEGLSCSVSVRGSKLARTEVQALSAKPSEREKDALIIEFDAALLQIGCKNNFSKLNDGHLYLIGEKSNRVHLPDSFWEALLSLTWLKSISITNYELILPESIGSLGKLTSIRLKNNQLKSLPDSISRLRKLRWINLEDNQLESLPISIQVLKKNSLQLDLRGNPLMERGENGKTLGVIGLKQVFGNRASIDPLQFTPQAKKDNDFISVLATPKH